MMTVIVTASGAFIIYVQFYFSWGVFWVFFAY